MDPNIFSTNNYDSSSGNDVQLGKRREIVTDLKEKKPKRQKSIYKGVFRCGNKFKAQIQTNGVQHYLGLFDDEKDAARAYDNHARVVLGSRAKTNLDYDASEQPDSFVVPPPPPLPAVKNNAEILMPDAGPEKPMSKRIYVGIKARMKRQYTPDTGANGGSSSSNSSQAHMGAISSRTSRSLCEAIADSVRDGHGNRAQRNGEGKSNSLIDYLNGEEEGDDISDDGDDDYEPDWRDQIYYWTGLLSYDAVNSCLLWKGSWLGSFTGKPNPDEFSWSSNEFEYLGEVLNLEELYVQGLLRPRSGRFKGYYMMDNDGSGFLEKYLDNEYYVEFEEVRGLYPPRYTVVGKGDSDFGTFVLTGTYNAGNRVLEMARQYISEDDERCSMNVNQLKMHLIAAAAAMS